MAKLILHIGMNKTGSTAIQSSLAAASGAGYVYPRLGEPPYKPHHEDGWVWNSGFEVSARIDQTAHVWYGAMRIPYSAIDTRPPTPGNSLRVNLFRSQGPESHRQEISWRAPMSETFHVPERFGLLKLVKKNEP